MKNERLTDILVSYFRDRATPFIRENKTIIAQFIFTLFFIAIAVWFVRQEKAELVHVRGVLAGARWEWVLAGIALTIVYLFLQGVMYVFSFGATHARVSLTDSVILFIKRNLISVFLPAGGISSLAFFTGPIENKGIRKSQIHFASTIYGFVGILTVVLVAIPAFLYALAEGTAGKGEVVALAAIVVLLLFLVLSYRSIMHKGRVYSLILRYFPSGEVYVNDLQSRNLDRHQFIYTILVSVIIEFAGILHLYVAMLALGIEPSLYAASMGYIVSVIFLIVSPFLRGFGPIEVSMTFVLIRFGLGNAEAVAVTLLYRFFEFWLPLIAGVFSFLMKLNRLLLRVLPALFLMLLGIVNLISVLTPAISFRLHALKGFLPVEVIHASNYLVMAAGFFLLVTAAFMLKGLRSAWWFALFLSVVSFIGHITKAIDYEEAIFALVVILMLISTHKEYYIRTNPKLRNVGIQTALLAAAATLVYGVIGFYFLDKHQFSIDFSLWQSVKYTVQNYFLIGSDILVPKHPFARDFLYSINVSGFLSITFVIYTLVRTYVPHKNVSDEELVRAKQLLDAYGNSSLDYFKSYFDKMIFFSSARDAFLAYRISGNFAVVLENPVAESHDSMRRCVTEFDRYCYESGLKSIYYRVPEESLDLYHELRKKDLFLGQEAVVDVRTFSLEGGARKSMRNAVNKVADRGYRASVHTPPVKDGILQKIKSVSDEWLHTTHRHEIVFSQGMFHWDELKQQTIITVESPEEKIVAFLNVLPDYVKNEATYDLIRKTKDAPNGIMDFILIEFFRYVQSKGIPYVNMGFAPMSGLDDPHTFPERSMKFAYEKIRSFSHYKGLREYKEKFNPVWTNNYLIYQHDYDLLQVPSVLSKVIKP